MIRKFYYDINYRLKTQKKKILIIKKNLNQILFTGITHK